VAAEDMTPATPTVSLRMPPTGSLTISWPGLRSLAAAHRLRDLTHDWALRCGFEPFAEEGYRSPTVSAIRIRAKSIRRRWRSS
jgi:aspartate aminotransferase-like enzyme